MKRDSGPKARPRNRECSPSAAATRPNVRGADRSKVTVTPSAVSVRLEIESSKMYSTPSRAASYRMRTRSPRTISTSSGSMTPNGSSAASTSWSTTPAGTKASPFVDSKSADWDRAIAVNLYGVLPVMAGQGHGAVVNLGSDAGRSARPARRSTPQPRTGHRVHQVAGPGDGAPSGPGQLRLPWPHRHRAVRVVRAAEAAGGPHRGHPVPPAGPAGRLANVVAFLAADEASFVTGQTVSVSGGLTMS